MKAEIISNKPKFEPFDVKLTIETEDELKELWHRLNIAPGDVKSASTKYGELCTDYNNGDGIKFWELLDEVAKERGIKIYK